MLATATHAATTATVISRLKTPPTATPKSQLNPPQNPSTLHFFNNPTPPLPTTTTTTTTTLRCSHSSSSSPSSSSFTSTFPTNIEVPDVKYFPCEDDDPNFHTFFLRMLIRDDDGDVEKKLASHDDGLLQWLLKEDTFSTLLSLLPTLTNSLAKGISGSLLEHADAWVAGYSLVLHEICDVKFLRELFKLEQVFDLYVKKRSDDSSSVPSVELMLMIVAKGSTTDRNVQSTDDLVDFLKSLESNKESILFIVPIHYPSHLSKEKLDKTEGYAHICLGKFP